MLDIDSVKNVFEVIRKQWGSLDFVVSDPSAAAPFAKEMDFFALPFLFRDYGHWQKSLDGEPGARYAKLVRSSIRHLDKAI
mgnify:CR=1 FL=1